MHAQKFPFAVRLIGFKPGEHGEIGSLLAEAPPAGPAYFCLSDDSLQEPDLSIVNGDDPLALAMLSGANPSEIKPAVIVGAIAAGFPFPQLSRPLTLAVLHRVLSELMAKRARALALVSARGMPVISERRRSPRLAAAADLTDPAAYEERRQPPPGGAVLIIDKGAVFRDHVASLLGTRQYAIEWTDSANAAVRLCDETPVSLVMINTSTPGIDPYQLCSAIKAQGTAARIAVVFLVSPAFRYDSARARAAGVRGLLDKPVADRHLVGALNKLLSLPS